MLDECKGEKFEEMLVAFSGLVLRKKLQLTQRRAFIPVAQLLGAADAPKSGDIKNMYPLALAHRASLGAKLKDRAVDKQLFDSFSHAMYTESQGVRQRQEELTTAQRSLKTRLSLETTKAIRTEVLRNWVGLTEGSQLLLDGVATSVSDLDEQASSSEALKTFRETGLLADPASEQDLLNRLDSTLKEQNHRLAQWAEYSSRLGGDNKGSSSRKDVQETNGSAKDISGKNVFNQHQAIRIGCPTQRSAVSGDAVNVRYQGVVATMKHDIAEVSKRARRERKQSITTRSSYNAATQKGISSNALNRIPLLRATTELSNNDIFSPSKKAGYQSDELDCKETPETHSRLRYPMQDTQNTEMSIETLQLGRASTPPIEQEHIGYGVGRRGSSKSHVYDEQYNATPIERGGNGHQYSAAHSPLGRSISRDGSPSNSIANTPTHALDLPLSGTISPPTGQDYIDQPESPPLPSVTRPSMVRTSSPPSATTEYDKGSSLADRTRQAMESATSDLKRRQSKREKPSSVSYPVNQFQTPVKTKPTTGTGEGEGSSSDQSPVGKNMTPKEKLFSDDAEYQSVFKSRPKIAASPVLSPMVEDFSMWDGEDGLHGVQSSPLGAFTGSSERYIR